MAFLRASFGMWFFRHLVARHGERLLLLAFMLSLVTAGQTVGAVAPTVGADPRLSQAVNWAMQQMAAPRLWLEGGVTLCDKFVENAFGVTAQYPTAYDMYLALGKAGDPAHQTLPNLQEAPAGAIIFFDRNTGNWNDGHVGIFVGNDQFISVVTGGRIKQHSVQWWNDHVAHFLGWAYPRADWPGYGKSKSIARSAPPAPSPQALDARSPPRSRSLSATRRAASVSSSTTTRGGWNWTTQKAAR
ncbi:MAG: C40 family peptidase [Thermomicrobia bacterium]|nr:C40 family peptidase [Thermomicrobia bacterium]